jgi:tRNA(fMet)-specific endonuclease VapC
MSMIADTDVLIDYLNARGPWAARIALEIDHGALMTTVISRFELFVGVRSAKQQKAVRTLLDAVPALPLDTASADRAADVRRTLEKQGNPIGMGDSLIAGIVLANHGVLLTGKTGHFERVSGLRLSGRFDRLADDSPRGQMP